MQRELSSKVTGGRGKKCSMVRGVAKHFIAVGMQEVKTVGNKVAVSAKVVARQQEIVCFRKQQNSVHTVTR
jgi:hypothetical protein